MASTSASRRTASTPAEQTFFPDEIWEEIFLRLDAAAADLTRASAACSSFRRIVSSRRFLRRFRALHSPPVLGFIRYGCREFLPVDPPHRLAPEARALDQAADFTFSFLPDPCAWRSRDARDGRVLLSRPIPDSIVFEDFVVCDPLHHRYVKIPQIPDDLLPASTTDHDMARHLVSVLAPAAENDGEEQFRVIYTVQLQLEDKVMAFVFSSHNHTWRGIVHTTGYPNGSIEYKPYYAHGCLYWMFYRMGYSLMLDTCEMKFSIVDLPPHNFDSMRAFVEVANDRLGFLTIGDDGTMYLYNKNRQSTGVGAQEWQQDKIPLPKDSGINYGWNIVRTVGRYVALVAHELIYDGPPSSSQYFVLDIKTLLVEKLCTPNNGVFCGFPYAGFPPPLALPSI